MKLKTIDKLKRIAAQKKVHPTIHTMKTNVVINPPIPKHAGEDITEKLNKSYLSYKSKYYK